MTKRKTIKNLTLKDISNGVYYWHNLSVLADRLPCTIRTWIKLHGFPAPRKLALRHGKYNTRTNIWNPIEVHEWLKNNQHLMNRKPGNSILYRHDKVTIR